MAYSSGESLKHHANTLIGETEQLLRLVTEEGLQCPIIQYVKLYDKFLNIRREAETNKLPIAAVLYLHFMSRILPLRSNILSNALSDANYSNINDLFPVLFDFRERELFAVHEYERIVGESGFGLGTSLVNSYNRLTKQIMDMSHSFRTGVVENPRKRFFTIYNEYCISTLEALWYQHPSGLCMYDGLQNHVAQLKKDFKEYMKAKDPDSYHTIDTSSENSLERLLERLWRQPWKHHEERFLIKEEVERELQRMKSKAVTMSRIKELTGIPLYKIKQKVSEGLVTPFYRNCIFFDDNTYNSIVMLWKGGCEYLSSKKLIGYTNLLKEIKKSGGTAEQFAKVLESGDVQVGRNTFLLEESLDVFSSIKQGNYKKRNPKSENGRKSTIGFSELSKGYKIRMDSLTGAVGLLMEFSGNGVLREGRLSKKYIDYIIQTSNCISTQNIPIVDSTEYIKRLVEDNRYLVYIIAKNIFDYLPNCIDFDDIVAAGEEGLFDAATKCDPEKQSTFKNYAKFRIRGAIMDELRGNDFVPRSVRNTVKLVEKTALSLEQNLGRAVSDEELARKLNLTMDQFYDIKHQIHCATLAHIEDIDEMTGNSEEGRSILNILSDDSDKRMLNEITTYELRILLQEAMETLPKKQREVLKRYFWKGDTVEAAGARLGIAMSTASTHKNDGLKNLRNFFKGKKESLLYSINSED